MPAPAPEFAPASTTNHEGRAGPLPLVIQSIGQRTLGRDLRLKIDDVIVAIDGKPINSASDRLDETLNNHPDLPALLTLYRGGNLVEIFVERGLGCTYRMADAVQANEIHQHFSQHQIKPKRAYHQFEALRDITRRVTLFRTDYAPLAAICPPLWLFYHRMWEPCAIILATLAVSIAIHPLLSILMYILFSVYFHRAQTLMLRGYALFSDSYFWMRFAAQNMRDAQMLLRKFDPHCRFKFSYVDRPDPPN